MYISSQFLMGNSSCDFQQGDHIGIASSIGRHCTLDNPIPILFLYHPYIPYFLIQEIFFLIIVTGRGQLTSLVSLISSWILSQAFLELYS